MKYFFTNFCMAILVIAFSLHFQSYAQDNSKNDLKSKIDKIKAQYKEIKSIESTLKVKSIDLNNEEEESSLHIYSLKNEIKKVIQSSAGGDCGEVYEVYYNQNKPFFVLYSTECFVDEKTTKTEQRYYLDSGKLIQYIVGKKTIKADSEEFKQAEEFIINQIKEISDLIK